MKNKNQKIPEHEYSKIVERRENGELIREISASYGVIDRTIYNIINKYKKNPEYIDKQAKDNRDILKQKILELAKLGNFNIIFTD